MITLVKLSAPGESILAKRPFCINKIQNLENFYLTLELEGAMSIIPMCLCGKLRGVDKRNKICVICGSPAEPVFSSPTSLYYYEKYNDLKFMSPVFIDRINKLLGRNSFEILITTPQLNHLGESIEKLTNDQRLVTTLAGGYERSYRFFVENLDRILLHFAALSKKKADLALNLLHTWRNEYDAIMRDYIYLPSRHMIVVEKVSKAAYTDLEGAYQTLELVKKGILFNKRHRSAKTVDKFVGSLVIGQHKLIRHLINKVLAGKTGDVRGGVNSTRATFSARAIITGIPNGSKYWEVHMPYTQMVATMRPFIHGWLIDYKKLSYKEAQRRYYRAETKVDHEILEFMNDLVEARRRINGKGYPMTMHRNPTLNRSTMQMLYCSKIKTNIRDLTFSISHLMILELKGDFDGDNTTIYPCHDLFRERMLESFDLVYSALDNSKPHQVSSKMSMSKPAVALWVSFQYHERDNLEDSRVTDELLSLYNEIVVNND